MRLFVFLFLGILACAGCKAARSGEFIIQDSQDFFARPDRPTSLEDALKDEASTPTPLLDSAKR